MNRVEAGADLAQPHVTGLLHAIRQWQRAQPQVLGRFAVRGIRGLAQVLDGQLVAMELLRSGVAVKVQAVGQQTATDIVDAAFRLGSLQVRGR